MIERLKSKWGIESKRRFYKILVVFSVTGIAILLVKPPLFRLTGLSEATSWWIKLPLLLVTYQILLLGIGTLFGEFPFFWGKLRRLGNLFTRSKPTA